MMKKGACSILAVLLIANIALAAEDSPTTAPEWKAGVASVAITPQRSLHMAGYAARKEPSEGTEQDLFAKALAIEDNAGNRLVIVRPTMYPMIRSIVRLRNSSRSTSFPSRMIVTRSTMCFSSSSR